MKPSCRYNLIWGLTALMRFKQGVIPLSPWTPICQITIRSFAPSSARIKSVADYTRSLFLFFLFVLLPFTASAKLKVVTTIPDLASLTQEVGGELVEAESLCRGDQDPHYLEPKPSYALLLNRADLLIEVGLELEVGWLPVLLTQARNPNVQPGQPGHLTASEGLKILEIPTGPIDRSQGDIHPFGNPHYWLNPRNGFMIAGRIAEKLSQLDPPHAAVYQKNLGDFQKRLTEKISTWEKELAPFRGKQIVTYHKSFSYFVDWTGLKVADLIEPKPGIPPSPSHILSLIERIRSEKIPLIITENYYDPKPAHELAERTGAKILNLPTSVGGEPSINSYEALFDYLIKKLKEVL